MLRPSGECTLGKEAIFAIGLNKPFGIAFYPRGNNPRFVYIAENDQIVRYPYENGQLVADKAPQVLTRLPQGAGHLPGKGHWTRDIAFSPDSSTMYVWLGSYSNDQNKGGR